MSYCVNCGVKLDPSLKYCPLCNTPVINPHDLSKMQPVSPFPKERDRLRLYAEKTSPFCFPSLSLRPVCAVFC